MIPLSGNNRVAVVHIGENRFDGRDRHAKHDERRERPAKTLTEGSHPLHGACSRFGDSARLSVSLTGA